MPRSTVPADVRFAIYDSIFAYAWALDRADADGIAATFTSDGVIINVTGAEWKGTDGIKQFALQAFEQPGFAGRQHHVQPLFIEPDGDGWSMTSYWMAVTWDAGRPAPEILLMGYYVDRYAQENGEWLCKHKTITRWDSGIAPMVGRSAPRPEPKV
jgi:uncharacterized protein (TIGR02246 family)